MPHRWNEAATTRRHQIESGLDLTFNDVFLPYYKNIVAQTHPDSLLEIGCGTGHLMATVCNCAKRSVAIEPSQGMYEVAKDVLSKYNVVLIHCPIEELETDEPFDLILSHLCIQTVDDLDSFLSAVCKHMDKSSAFVFSIPHPCFFNGYKQFFSPDEYRYMDDISKEVSFAITKAPEDMITGVPYYHRPLSRYFESLKRNGFCVTDWDEIFPPADIQRRYGQDWQVPRYCAFHCQKR